MGHFYDLTWKKPGTQGICQATPEKACKYYLKHYRNILLLERLLEAVAGDFKQERQVEEEMVVGTRKRDYWYRHPEFEMNESVIRQLAAIKTAVASINF